MFRLFGCVALVCLVGCSGNAVGSRCEECETGGAGGGGGLVRGGSGGTGASNAGSTNGGNAGSGNGGSGSGGSGNGGSSNGGSSNGGSGNAGSGNGGSGNGGSGNVGTAGVGGAGNAGPDGGVAGGSCGPALGDPLDACVGLESAYKAQYPGPNGPRSVDDIANECTRVNCIGKLGTPTFPRCVADCIDGATGDALAANDCSYCPALVVECAASTCISKCLSDKDECGPNQDQSCCAACLCEEGAYDAASYCAGFGVGNCVNF